MLKLVLNFVNLLLWDSQTWALPNELTRELEMFHVRCLILIRILEITWDDVRIINITKDQVRIKLRILIQ